MKKKKIFNIDIIFTIYMIVAMIFTIMQVVDFEVIIEGLKGNGSASPTQFMQIVLALIFSCILITIVKNIFIIIIYIGIKIGTKMYKNERLSQNDFKKTKDYYRDILQGYSPATLSFIDNFEIEYPSTIIATLLQLDKNNLIKTKEGLIEKNLNVETEDIKLEENEKYILDKISNNKIKIKDEELKEKIIKDALEKGLIENIENGKEKRKKKLFKSIIIMFITLGICFVITNSMGDVNISGGILPIILFLILIISLIVFIGYPFVLVTSYITYIAKNQNCPYVRTPKGEEINKKLEGLKIYLKDYSSLQDKKENEVTIWEEYLAYSVLFNQNTKIIEKYKQNIEIEQ